MLLDFIVDLRILLLHIHEVLVQAETGLDRGAAALPLTLEGGERVRDFVRQASARALTVRAARAALLGTMRTDCRFALLFVARGRLWVHSIELNLELGVYIGAVFFYW